MTLRIRNNTSAINSHRALQVNDQNAIKSLERLSSGLEILRASDGPASLVISEQMRSQVAGLEQAIRNSETDIAMIQTTESSLEEVNRILTSLRQLAVHAANDAVNDELMLKADQLEWENSLDALDRIARDTQFGNKKILDGSGAANGVVSGLGLEFVTATANTEESTEEGYAVVVTQNATRSILVGEEELEDDIIASGENIRISTQGKMIEYTTTEKDNLESVIQQLNLGLKRENMDLAVEEQNQRLVIRHNKYGSEHTFQASSSTAGVISREASQFQQAFRGVDIAGRINGEATTGRGQFLSGLEGSETTDGVVLRYDGNVGQADGPDIPDEGLTVGRLHIKQNSLRFHIGPNADQNLGVSLGSVSSRKLANGVQNESGYENIRDVNLTNFQGANDALRLLERAIDQVSSMRSDLGSFQKNNLESNVLALRVARENMIASESVIRDVDMAEEMSTLTREQILVSSSTAMLAQANQSAKSVLSLVT